MSKVTARIFAAALVTTSFAAPVVAQEGRGRTVTLGMGVQIAPEYYGADSYAIFPLPRFGLRREGRPMPFGAPDDSTGFGLLGQDSAFNIGPAVQLIAKREEDDVGAPVGDVGLTVEAGGFAQVFIGDNFRLRGELRQGIGGHEGLVGDIAADLILRDGDNTIFSIGPRVRWGDNDFHDAYFAVPFAIPAIPGGGYDPGSGFYAVGARAGYTQRIGRNWGLYAFAAYDRLIGDAADSPIVRQLGSRGQLSGGLGLFIEFNVGGGR